MRHATLILATCFLASCSSDIPTVSLGLDDSYRIARMQTLRLEPALSGDSYIWRVNGQTAAHTRSFTFVQAEEGIYHIDIEIDHERTPYSFSFTVNVVHEEIEYSPYITRVTDYCPAPGQFVNVLPLWEPGDTYEDMRRKAEESISGTNDEIISLGGYGGYVTFAFDHTVVNIPGENDFLIYGNAFYQGTQTTAGGSSEPGIVAVALDENGNGLPDDTWYELKGSEYYSPATIHNYTVSYRRPDDSADSDLPAADPTYITWTDSEGRTGYIPKNIFHTQSYYPQWVDEDKLTFTGSLLAPNSNDSSSNGTYFILYPYDWGYVDNHPNKYPELNSFDISNAVDAQGNAVRLPGADFIKVYTGVNQNSGWLGESSTELSHARDLHIKLP